MKNLTCTTSQRWSLDAYIRMRGVKQLYNEIARRWRYFAHSGNSPMAIGVEVKDPNGYVLVFSELIRAIKLV